MEKQLDFFNLKNNSKKKFNKKDVWTIFVDGAARGNPGPAGAGIFIKHNKKEFLKSGFYLGKKTNNQAEYLSLALAIFLIKEKVKNNKIEVFSDSELLVKQMNGIYKVKNPNLKNIKASIDSMIKYSNNKFTHIVREKNQIADQLANAGIDSKRSIPKEFILFLEKNETPKI